MRKTSLYSPVAAGLCAVTLALSSCVHDRAPPYFSAFGEHRTGFGVQWTGKGELHTSLDADRRAPSGAPCLRTICREASTGSVGVSLRPGAARTWTIELWASTELEQGTASLNLQCWDAAGKQIDWISLGTLPAGPELRPVLTMAVVPASAVRVNLLVLHRDAKGTTWLGDLRVRPFEPSPAQLAASRPAGPTRWAATGVLRAEEPTLRDTGAKLLATAGVTHTRAALDWRQAEPEPGHYDFAALDGYLRELSHYGITAAVVCIHGTPSWASGKSGESDLPEERKAKGEKYVKRAFWAPRDWSAWEQFVAALVTHFKGRVPAWEILNEPDLWTEGFCGTYEQYTQYLRSAHGAARRADPQCQVLLAAFVHGNWLPDLIRDGLTACVDGFCIHPYHSTAVGVLSKARRQQALLLAAGVSKPLWVTEIGFQSGGWTSGPGVTQDEHEKAQAGKQALASLTTVTDFVCWYTGIERGRMYGLLRDEKDRYRPMPMYYAYGNLTESLPADGHAPVKASVYVERERDQDSAWRVSMRAENQSDASVQTTFWPVGLVANLGFTLDEVRGCEWRGTLAPGESHETSVTVRPKPAAQGRYPVGLAVLTPAGNDLELRMVTAK